jgi:hypothetical protein
MYVLILTKEGLAMGNFFSKICGHPGVDVMITIFCDFCLRFLTIFGEKIGVFLKKQCYDQKFA